MIIYFWLGMGITATIEIVSRICNSNGEPSEEIKETAPVSISNGTIFKTLVGLGILGWLFKEEKRRK
jgi:hypothetical protein